MAAFVVRHARFRQATLGLHITVDAPLGLFAPLDVECPHLREEIERRIRQVVVDPPGEFLPIALPLKNIPESGHYHAGRRAHPPRPVTPVPDMIGIVGLVAGAAQTVLIAELVDGAATIGRADSEPAEALLQRFEQFLAQPSACSDGKVRVVWDIRQSVNCGDVGEQEIAHEEALRQTYPAKIF